MVATVPTFGYNGTILFTLLPYVEQTQLFNSRLASNKENTFHNPNVATHQAAAVKAYICPSDFTVRSNGINLIGFTGATYAANYQLFGTIIRVNNFEPRFNLSEIPDGTSNTVALGEQLSVGYVSLGNCLNLWDA